VFQPDIDDTMKTRFSMGPVALSLLAALFFVVAGNQQFWSQTLAFFSPLQGHNLELMASLFSVTFCLLVFLLNLIAIPWLFRPLLTLILLCNAAAAYFMNGYGISIDRDMLQNVFETDPTEAFELINLKLISYLLVLGVLPCLLVWRIDLRYTPWGAALGRKLAVMALALAVIGGNAWFFYQDYASFFRNKGEVRRFFTPVNFIYASGDYVHQVWFKKPTVLEAIGQDAKRPVATGQEKPTLFVIVVGETARAANFGLDGYSRQTTPQLAKLDVINYPQASSCGTATATSVPCMFSPMARKEYKASQHKESLLDVVQRAGISVLWKDNNSGCKGTCNRVPSEDVSQKKDPRWCRNGECFDEIMLEGLDQQLAHHKGDLLLVLHQKGSHGPAYYLRYPDEFAHFTPVCQTNKLQDCSRETITNAYDNTILYTDHVLARVIELLKQQQDHYNTALWYMSDHGESLGENNLYLHGAPYSFAPETQTHVPMVQWISDGFAARSKLDLNCLRQVANRPVSHDNLFHSMLGILDIQTSAYQPELDLFKACRKG
jgi:lipid A ethanolaminephosphotransferase